MSEFVGELVGEVRQVVPRVPKYARLTWFLLKAPGLSGKQKAALLAAVGYSVSPVDAIPGIIPVIGQLDDLAVVLYTLRWIFRSMPPEQADQHLASAGLTREVLDDDFHLVERNGTKILKKMLSLMGWMALTIWSAGRFTSREISKRIRKSRAPVGRSLDDPEETDIG